MGVVLTGFLEPVIRLSVYARFENEISNQVMDTNYRLQLENSNLPRLPFYKLMRFVR